MWVYDPKLKRYKKTFKGRIKFYYKWYICRPIKYVKGIYPRLKDRIYFYRIFSRIIENQEDWIKSFVKHSEDYSHSLNKYKVYPFLGIFTDGDDCHGDVPQVSFDLSHKWAKTKDGKTTEESILKAWRICEAIHTEIFDYQNKLKSLINKREFEDIFNKAT